MMDQSSEGARDHAHDGDQRPFDLMEELFEHDKVKAHFGRVAGENLVRPDEKATGIGAYVFLGFLEKFGFGVPVGGSGSLTNALIALHRGSRRRGAQQVPGARSRTDGGRATGVVLDSGERLSRGRGRSSARSTRISCPSMVPAGAADRREERPAHAHHRRPPASPSTPRPMRRSSSRPATSRR